MNTWGMADIHVHTTASDGFSTAAEVLRAAGRAGLHVIAITDHDTIDGALEARALAEHGAVEVVVGEEISTREGHLLALFLSQRVAPGRPLADTIAEVHAQGGLCIAAHPYDWMVSSVGAAIRQRAGRDWQLDGLEAFNASMPLGGMNRRAAQAARDLGLAALGGSDSHHAATVGAGYTLFPGRGAADLRAAICAGTVVARGSRWALGDTGAYVLMALAQGLRGLVQPGVATTPSTR